MSQCDGGYLYTEGFFDDINKIYNLGLYWDRNRTDEETLSDYCNYEYKGIDPTDFIKLIDLIETSHLKCNRFDRLPGDLDAADAAWELAQKINEQAAPETKTCWRWRILYIRAYLDKVRYHKCAEAGWPLHLLAKSSMFFWREYLEHDEKAQEMLLELIHLYKGHEQDSHKTYAYHFYVRPPRNEGTDWNMVEWNKKKMNGMM